MRNQSAPLFLTDPKFKQGLSFPVCWFFLCATVISTNLGCAFCGKGAVPENVATCQKLSQMGMLCLERGSWKEAQDHFKDALDADPEDPEAHRYSAEALWQQGKIELANEQITSAIEKSPDNPVYRLRAAEMAYDSGEFDRAKFEVAQALDLDPELGPAWALRGTIESDEGKVHESILHFQRALKTEPYNAQYLTRVAQLYQQEEQYIRSLTVIHQIRDLYAERQIPADVLYLTGTNYLALNRPKEAQKQLVLALQQDQNNAKIHCAIGLCMLEQGNLAQAHSTASAILAQEPNNPQALALSQRINAIVQRESNQTIQQVSNPYFLPAK